MPHEHGFVSHPSYFSIYRYIFHFRTVYINSSTLLFPPILAFCPLTARSSMLNTIAHPYRKYTSSPTSILTFSDNDRYFWSKFGRFHPSACICTQYALHLIANMLLKLVINLVKFGTNIEGYVHTSWGNRNAECKLKPLLLSLNSILYVNQVVDSTTPSNT